MLRRLPPPAWYHHHQLLFELLLPLPLRPLTITITITSSVITALSASATAVMPSATTLCLVIEQSSLLNAEGANANICSKAGYFSLTAYLHPSVSTSRLFCQPDKLLGGVIHVDQCAPVLEASRIHPILSFLVLLLPFYFPFSPTLRFAFPFFPFLSLGSLT